MADKQSSNPKDIIGDTKLPLHLWPTSATAYGCMGMLEGKLKYGLVNFRGTKVQASVYVAAAKRHLDEWYEGMEFTEEGGPVLGNALASIAIIVDAITNETLIDDRPYTPKPGAYHRMREMLSHCQGKLKALFGDRNPKHWTRACNEEGAPSKIEANRWICRRPGGCLGATACANGKCPDYGGKLS